jgi:PAS domain S-box-containing protein
MRRVKRFPAWAVFLCAGAGAALAYVLFRDPVFQAVVALGLVTAALAAVVGGIGRHRPAPRLPWVLLAASLVAAVGSWALWERVVLSTGSPPAPGTVQDVFWIASNVLLLATASFFLARRQAGVAGYLDAGILACAFALAAWALVFEPEFGAAGPRDLSAATTLTYALLDAVMLAVLLRGMPSLRRAPAVLVVAAIAAVLATDSLYNWLGVITDAYVPGAWADLGWLLSPALLGAAALHPDMARVFERRPGRERRVSRAVVALLGLAALAAPVAGVLKLATGREIDSFVGLAFSVLLSGLVVLRLGLLIRRSEHLDARARRLAAIVESSSDAIISMDVDGTVRSWNGGASRLYGYEAAEVLGRSIEILVPADRHEDREALVARLAAGEEIESFETVSAAKDGRRVEISLSVSPIRGTRGELTGFSTIARDVTEQRRAAVERARLAAIAEASSDAIVGTDVGGRVTSWNAAAEALSGWRAADMLGRSVAHVIAPERHGDLPEILTRLRRGERVISFDTRLVRKDGAASEISLSVALVRGEDGRATGFSAVARDVTLTREAERKLREAEERYRRLVEQLPLATYIDAPGGLGSSTYLSPQIGAMVGYTPEEWLEDRELFQKLLHPDDRDRVVAEVRRATRAGEPVLHEYRFVARDGRIVWVRDSAVVVHDEDGRPAWRQGFVIDITATKAAEERTRLAEARYRSLVEQLPLAVYIAALDEDNSTIYVGPQIEDMLGYPVEEWFADRELFAKLLHPEDRERVMAEVRDSLQEHTPWRCEYRMIGKDGRVVWIHDEDRIIRGEDGSPLYSQGFMLDISERVEAERELGRLLDLERAHNEELRELDGLKDEFVALVSHELRTPLTSIRGYLELVLDGAPGSLDEEQERFLRVVERNAIRLQGLVGDLLFIAQVEAGRLALERAPVDVVELVAEAVEAARPAAAEKGIGLAAETAEATPFAGDRGRLGQLLDNLVSNAVKFTPAGGRVTVRASTSGDRLVLQVADTGIGIPAPEQHQLFQRFFRASSATAEAIPGTGLGLTIAKAIAEAHGGAIRCESTEGTGTTFTVELPLAADAELEEAA